MNDIIFQTINSMNIPQLIAFGTMLWFFCYRIEKKMNHRCDNGENLSFKSSKRNNKFYHLPSNRIDKMDARLNDVDLRLCWLEGAFCYRRFLMFKENNYKKNHKI